jgi:DNA-binding transcriptional ArsR family regulator
MMMPLQSTLEDTISSKVRLRILKLLAESQALTASEIAVKVGVNYAVTRAHLDALEKGGILTHANFGKRIRYYRFKESAKAYATRNLIEAWSSPKNPVSRSSEIISEQNQTLSRVS